MICGDDDRPRRLPSRRHTTAAHAGDGSASSGREVQLIGDEDSKNHHRLRVAIVEVTLNDGTKLSERVEGRAQIPKSEIA